MTNEAFNWGDLGEKWWRENGSATRATEQLLPETIAPQRIRWPRQNWIWLTFATPWINGKQPFR
jgi:hypothetical protein